MADITFKQFAGLKNTVNPERLEEGDLVAAMNVAIGDNGQLSRRTGMTKKVTGQAHSLWSKKGVCLFVQSGVLKRLHPDYSTETIRVLPSDDAVTYDSVNGRVYYSNGTITGVIDVDGRDRTWGIIPPGLPSAAPTGGSLPEGTYQYLVTYVREDGQESGAGLAGRIDTAGGIMFTNIPVSDDPGVTHKIIYVTPQNGDVFYRAAVLENSTSSYNYRSGALSLPLTTQYMQEAPAGDIVAYHFGTMYVVKGEIVFYSSPFGYELFDLRDYLAFDSPVQIFAPVDGGIWVGTKTQISWLPGIDPSKMEKGDREPVASVKGTLAYAQASDLPDFKERPDSNVALWWTDGGVCAGFPSGVLHKLTDDRYRPGITGLDGAGLVTQTVDGKQYVAVINS